MALPSIADIAHTAKRRKREKESLLSSFQNLSSIDATILDKLDDSPREANECWLVARYGLEQVMEAKEVLTVIPDCLTDDQQKRLLSELCDPSIEEVATILLSRFQYFVTRRNRAYPLILTPPTKCCYECGRQLVSNHKTNVKCYSLNACTGAVKYTLRCRRCDITYNYAHFGNKRNAGFRFYPCQREYVEVSDTVYFTRQLLEWQCSLANHSWVSFQGFAESLNVSLDLPVDQELTPHITGEAFYNGELENELRRIGQIEFRMYKDSDREKCMETIEELRRQTIYPHVTCTTECKQRGCGALWVTDGIWKTVFPHCMFRVEQTATGFTALNLPDVCTSSPLRGKAFCQEHCALLEKEAPEVPVDLREFLKFCGTNAKDEGEVCQDDTEKVDKVVNSLLVSSNTVGQSAATSQGTSALIEEHPELVQEAVFSDPTQSVCKKDTGTTKSLRKWSRGHQFVVRGGGHIDTWQPLYRSESPSQVFFILIQWLISLAKMNGIPENEKMYLAYDNMCNLAKLKVARAPLPLPHPLDKLWINLNKIIDVFHFQNHVSPDCKEKFNPDKLKADHPDYNTQAGEQTFVWVYRFSKILCSMNKVHHLFYLHRMVLRRNQYTSLCQSRGKKPILPKVSKKNRKL